MITAKTKIAIAFAFLSIACLTACKKTEVTPQEQAESLLTAGAWAKPTVTVDGVDHSDLYQNFTVQFINKTYSSSGGLPLWPAAGTWMMSEDGKTLKIDGKLEMQISEMTDKALQLTFQWDKSTYAPGRVQSIGGRNVFNLKR